MYVIYVCKHFIRLHLCFRRFTNTKRKIETLERVETFHGADGALV